MNTLTDRYTDGVLVNRPRWFHYLEKFGAGCLSLAGAFVVVRLFGASVDGSTFAIACGLSWAVYVLFVLSIAAESGTLFPLSGYVTWHQLTKLSLHAFPMALASFRFLVRPTSFVLAVLVVLAWLVAWPHDDAS